MSSNPGPRRETRRWVVGLAVIACLGLFGYSAFRGSLATYTHDFAEVERRSGELLQVPGVVDKNAPQRYDTSAGWFEFEMLDVGTQTQRLKVRTQQVKPGNFDEASQVICIGSYRDGVFVARQLLVKCPSKELDKMRATEAPEGQR